MRARECQFAEFILEDWLELNMLAFSTRAASPIHTSRISSLYSLSLSRVAPTTPHSFSFAASFNVSSSSGVFASAARHFASHPFASALLPSLPYACANSNKFLG